MSPFHRLSITVAVLATLTSLADAAPSKLDPMARRALAQVGTGASRAKLEASGISVNEARDLDVFVLGSATRAELEAAGAQVRTSLPGVTTAYIPAGAVDRVAALSDVTGIEGAVRVEPMLDVSVPSTGADMLRGPGPSFTGLNGQGVVIGVVDTGVDYDHGDFKKSDGTTRLLSIWDQTDLAGPNPSGYAYGTEWLPAQIDAHSAREVDTNGHGTHVLGIAGGDGSATGGSIAPFTYVGMAPKADLVAVKTNFDTGIIDGVAYVLNRAQSLGKNAVVNLSLGTLFGPKDGTSGFESGMNALTGPGHIVVAAAGNSGGKAVHAEVNAPASGSASCTLQIGALVTGGPTVALDGYYEAGGNATVTITTPDGATVGPIALGGTSGTYPGPMTTNGRVYLENGASVTATGDPEVYVELSLPDPNPTSAHMNGTWTITLNDAGASPVLLDLWQFFTDSPTTGANFAVGNRPDEKLVIEPANAPDLITAGAWTTKVNWVDCGNRSNGYGPPWQVGMLALFSSPGPTRDGRQKPDIAAPGIGIGSAQTYDVPVSCPGSASSLLQDMQHVIMEGTSMAAPHVAGAVALLLQKYGAMTPAAIKSLLFARAKTDGFTGAVWNNGWGNGKLFLGDLTDPLSHVDSPNGGESLAIGTSASLMWTASDAYQGVTSVDLALQRTSNGPFETIATGISNSGSYAWTVTGPATGQARLRVTARDAAGNTGVDLSDTTFTITGAAGLPADAIAEFSLEIRSANPARGPVDVAFSVPRGGPVEVAVFDLAGRKLSVLAHGVHAAGRYAARWNAGTGSSRKAGMVFIRLEAPGHVIARRVVMAG